MHWSKDKKCCACRFFLVNRKSYNQSLTELRIKINVDKYSNFASRALGHLVLINSSELLASYL